MYSSNLQLSREQAISSFGFQTTPALHLERNSPTSQIAFDGRFEFAEYVDNSEFNSQDQFLDLAVDQAITERSALRLTASFTHDTNVTSEQDVTGRFVNKPYHFIAWDVAPGWAYQLTPIDQMVVRGSYRKVIYDTNQKTDYQYFGPAIDYSRQLNELSKVTATLSAWRYVPDEPGDNYTDTISTLFGYAYDPSERFSISGGLGFAYSMRHEDPGKDKDFWGYRAKFDMKYQISDQTYARASLSHDTEPTGDGNTVVRNRASVGLNYQLTPLTTTKIDVDYADNVDFLGTESSISSNEQTSRYTSVRPAVAYQLTEDWSLEAQYRFRYRLFQDHGGGDAMANEVYLTLQYNFPTWAGTGY